HRARTRSRRTTDRPVPARRVRLRRGARPDPGPGRRAGGGGAVGPRADADLERLRLERLDLRRGGLFHRSGAGPALPGPGRLRLTEGVPTGAADQVLGASGPIVHSATWVAPAARVTSSS